MIVRSANAGSLRGEGTVMLVIATHEVDDVEHWYNSPKRAEFFDQHGMKVTAFRDPAGSTNMTAVLIETPDLETLQAALETEEAQRAEEYDGVDADTITILVAG
jgi:uncharacterized protein (DUF1330 family)